MSPHPTRPSLRLFGDVRVYVWVYGFLVMYVWVGCGGVFAVLSLHCCCRLRYTDASFFLGGWSLAFPAPTLLCVRYGVLFSAARVPCHVPCVMCLALSFNSALIMHGRLMTCLLRLSCVFSWQIEVQGSGRSLLSFGSRLSSSGVDGGEACGLVRSRVCVFLVCVWSSSMQGVRIPSFGWAAEGAVGMHL